MCLKQLEEGRADVENQYLRAVSREGNRAAIEIMRSVFEITDRKWRGIGRIPDSGFSLRERFAGFDAGKRFEVGSHEVDEPEICISGEVLRGNKKPFECEAFGKECTPERPLGAPMVSSEGACAAYYRYRLSRKR